MITALDSSVILDLLQQDSTHFTRSLAAFRSVQKKGRLIICNIVGAEVYPALTIGSLSEFLQDWQIEYVPGDLEHVQLAGRYFSDFKKRTNRHDASCRTSSSQRMPRVMRISY